MGSRFESVVAQFVSFWSVGKAWNHQIAKWPGQQQDARERGRTTQANMVYRLPQFFGSLLIMLRVLLLCAGLAAMCGAARVEGEVEHLDAITNDIDMLELAERQAVHNATGNTTGNATAKGPHDRLDMNDRGPSRCLKMKAWSQERTDCEAKEEAEAKSNWHAGWAESGGDPKKAPTPKGNWTPKLV